MRKKINGGATSTHISLVSGVCYAMFVRQCRSLENCIASIDCHTQLIDCWVQETDYFTPQGEFRVDAAGSQTLLNCLMYKLSYFRFGELQVCNPVYKLLYSLFASSPSL